MKKWWTLFFCFLSTACFFSLLAQPPFWGEIQDFKKADSVNPPPQHSILFVGSSSFQKWKDVQDYFPGYPIINRGFGGSSLPDVIRYASEVIYPYQPKQVVIYCGDNDLAASDTVSAQTVYHRFQELFGLIRSHLPKASIVFVSIKPSPSRERLMPKMEAANQLIQQFLKRHSNTSFVDVYHLMLRNGKPIDEIFLDDKLHMNKQGYTLWQKAIQPYLLKSQTVHS